MKTLIKLLFLLTLSFSHAYAQLPETSYEKAAPFIAVEDPSIEWGYFTVPEDWNSVKGKKIQLAVAILKSKTSKENNEPLLAIEGGPGADAINGIWFWLDHPIREKRDIVLVDLRGTGFSKPRLCPDLGKDFFKIFAKNQNTSLDEKDKVLAALSCQKYLLANDIDIYSYHSKSIARDLNALKIQLKYKQWNVEAVSYGTYVAQVYTSDFPGDIKTLILDSPISNLDEYYTKNTSNYMSSLKKMFEACKNDSSCNAEFPDLEKCYYTTIEELTKKPLTVKVDKAILEKGEFTYNAEDFKIVIQQSFYQKKLREVLPLLIYQFHNKNEKALSSLIAGFSEGLALDYGMYYCVTCREGISDTLLKAYNEDASQYKLPTGGLSFYKTDFEICRNWNSKKSDSLNIAPDLKDSDIPTLIFTGGFDPITPASNGKDLNERLKKSTLVYRSSYGHGSSFTKTGSVAINEFINDPTKKPDFESLNFSDKITFVTKININSGIAKLGNSVSNFDVLFSAPLIIALLVSIVAIFAYLFLLIRRKDITTSNKIMKLALIISSILAVVLIVNFVMALNNVASDNFYILAFGLPVAYNHLFTILFVFLGVLLFNISYFFINIKHIISRSIVFTVLFSNILIGIYFYYWGLF